MTDLTNLDDLLNADDFEIEIDDLSAIEDIDDPEFPPLKKDEGSEEIEDSDENDDDTPPVPPSKNKKPLSDEPVAPIEDEDDDEIDEDDIHQTFEIVAKGLSKLGNFPTIPAGAKLTEEKFLELYSEFTKQQAMADIEELVLERHGKEGMKVFQDIFVNGASPREYLSAYQKQLDYENLDVEDSIQNQKLIVRQYLSSIDWEDGDIEEHIDTLLESKKLESMAQNYKTKLVKKQKIEMDALAEETKKRAQMEKEMKEKRISDLSKVISIASKEKSINGIPLSDEDNKTLLSYMTDDAYRLPSGQVITEFDKDYLELKKDPVKFAALAKLVKSGLDVTKIKDKGLDELEDRAFEFRSKTKKSKSSTGGYDFLDKFLK